MSRPKQLSLFKDPRKKTKLWWIVKQTTYGGDLNYRKVARPFDSKKLTNAVFKSQLGTALRFTRSQLSIRKLLERVATACDVKIKDVAINHDHIHLLFAAKTKENQTRFLRLFAAEMGRKYKSLMRKFGIKKNGSMWKHRPFTRLVSWGKSSLDRVRDYFEKNRQEAAGLVEYMPRDHQLVVFLKQWKEQNLYGSSA